MLSAAKHDNDFFDSMSIPRPYALTIAGFDSRAGAGVLADVKTLEASGVYGLVACTALTVQNDVAFEHVSWVPLADVRAQIRLLEQIRNQCT